MIYLCRIHIEKITMYWISKIKLYLILFAIFIVPIAFNPYFGDIFTTMKAVLIVFISALVFLLWSVECVYQRKFFYRSSWINQVIFFIVGICLVTTVANLPFVSSWLGQGDKTAINSIVFGANGGLGLGLITICAMALFFFSITSTLNSEEKIHVAIRTFTLSAGVVAVLTFLQAFFPGLNISNNFSIVFKGYDVTNLYRSSIPLYPTQSFSPVGEYYVLPLFFIISALLQLFLSRTSLIKRNLVYVLDLILLTILILGFLVTTWVTVFNIFFYIIGAFAIVAALFNLNKSHLPQKKRNIWMQTVAVSFVWALILGFCLIKFVNFQQTTSPSAPLNSSWTIAFSTLSSSVKNGIFGIGPENFSVAYLQFKDTAINTTPLAFETLNKSGNYILETLTNFGLVGFIVLGLLIYKLITYYFKNREDLDQLQHILFLVLGVIAIATVFISFNITIIFLLFVIFALLATSTSSDKDIKNVVFALRGSAAPFADKLPLSKSDKNFSQTIFFGFAVVLFLAVGYLSWSLVTSNLAFVQTYLQGDLSQEANLNKALDKSFSATSAYSFADNFYARNADLLLQKLAIFNQSISDKYKNNVDAKNLTSDEQNFYLALISQIDQNVNKAIEINPLNFENYLLSARANVQFALLSNKSADLINKSLSASILANRLNPTNPSADVLAYTALYVRNDSAQKDLDAAAQFLTQAIKIYPSLSEENLKKLSPDSVREYVRGYVQVYVTLSQLFRQQKKYPEAIAVITEAQSRFFTSDSDDYKKLTDFITTLNTEKKQYDATVPATSIPTVTPTVTPTTTKVTTTTTKKN